MKHRISILFYCFTLLVFFQEAHASNADVERLASKLASLSFEHPPNTLECFTHSKNGHGYNVHVSEETKLKLKTKQGVWSLKFVNSDFPFFSMNQTMFSKRVGGSFPNHLFVSLEVCYTKAGTPQKLQHALAPLFYNSATGSFVFAKKSKDDLCYADFCSQVPNEWKTTQYCADTDHPIQIVDGDAAGIALLRKQLKESFINNHHSETRALSVLSLNPMLLINFIKEAIPADSTIHLLLYRFHSFLDFCTNCQVTVPSALKLLKLCPRYIGESDLLPNHHLAKNCPVTIIAQANKCYNRNMYGEKSLKTGSLARKRADFQKYFLKKYRPFMGKVAIGEGGEDNMVVYSYVQSPTTYGSKTQPLNRELDSLLFPDSTPIVSTYSADVLWEHSTSHKLYDNMCPDLAPILSLNLTKLDLSKSRFGIDESADDGEDGFALSDGTRSAPIITPISKQPTLIELNLSGNAFHSRHYKHTALCLGKLTNLVRLDISNTFSWSPLSRFTASFGEVLSGLSKLEVLNLSSNGLMLDNFLDIAFAFSELVFLKELDLSKNRLSFDVEGWGNREEYVRTDQVLQHLTEYVLPYTTSLQSLDLNRNGFDEVWSDIGQEDLEKALQSEGKIYLSD